MDISQEELADAAEIDRSYMSSVERGQQNIGLISAVKIAQALGITLAELIAEAHL